MILVDTSVVIDYVRGKDAKLVSLLPTLAVAVCGIVRAELLYGSRRTNGSNALLTLLNTFQQLPIPDSVWDTVGDNPAGLRAAGITVPFQDVVLATIAIENDIELWTRDTQFTMIQTMLPVLRLFQEPP